MYNDRVDAPHREYDQAEDTKMAQIESKLPTIAQEKSIAVVHETLDRLEERLRAVLAPETPINDTAEQRVEDPSSPLGQTLAANNRRIQSLTYRIENIMSRLEC